MTTPRTIVPTRIIGWLCADAMLATAAAEKAIAKVAEFGRLQGAFLHYDLVTGRLTLTDRDARVPPNTFVRGVAWNSDPDVLADDLSGEAWAARLIRRPNENGRPARAARRAA